MYKVSVVVSLICVVVCDCFILKDYEPAATSYSIREDSPGGGKVNYGVSKNYGYQKMIVTTYLSPVPEEVSASYNSYVIHPIDHQRCGYNSPQANPEEALKMSTMLQMFPIIVPENDQVDESEQQPQAGFREIIVDDKLVQDADDDTYRRWVVNKDPGQEAEDLFKRLFIQEEPKNGIDDEKAAVPQSAFEEYWKRFKRRFDELYEKNPSHFTHDDEDDEEDYADDNDDDEDDDDEDNDEGDDYGEDDDKEDNKLWYGGIAGYYDYQERNNQNDDDKWNGNIIYVPKDAVQSVSQYNGDSYGYVPVRKW